MQNFYSDDSNFDSVNQTFKSMGNRSGHCLYSNLVKQDWSCCYKPCSKSGHTSMRLSREENIFRCQLVSLNRRALATCRVQSFAKFFQFWSELERFKPNFAVRINPSHSHLRNTCSVLYCIVLRRNSNESTSR
jgi:hypothetical protein